MNVSPVMAQIVIQNLYGCKFHSSVVTVPSAGKSDLTQGGRYPNCLIPSWPKVAEIQTVSYRPDPRWQKSQQSPTVLTQGDRNPNCLLPSWPKVTEIPTVSYRPDPRWQKSQLSPSVLTRGDRNPNCLRPSWPKVTEIQTLFDRPDPRSVEVRRLTEWHTTPGWPGCFEYM
jgi:hypothetical protein